MSLLKSLKGLYKGWDGELIVKRIHWMYLDNAIYNQRRLKTCPLDHRASHRLVDPLVGFVLMNQKKTNQLCVNFNFF